MPPCTFYVLTEFKTPIGLFFEFKMDLNDFLMNIILKSVGVLGTFLFASAQCAERDWT